MVSSAQYSQCRTCSSKNAERPTRRSPSTSVSISLLRVFDAFASFAEKRGREMTNDNKCNSSVELGAAMDGEDAKGGFLKEKTVRKIKSIAGHVGLLIALMLYTAIGGLVRLKTRIAMYRKYTTEVRSTMRENRGEI